MYINPIILPLIIYILQIPMTLKLNYVSGLQERWKCCVPILQEIKLGEISDLENKNYGINTKLKTISESLIGIILITFFAQIFTSPTLKETYFNLSNGIFEKEKMIPHLINLIYIIALTLAYPMGKTLLIWSMAERLGCKTLLVTALCSTIILSGCLKDMLLFPLAYIIPLILFNLIILPKTPEELRTIMDNNNKRRIEKLK